MRMRKFWFASALLLAACTGLPPGGYDDETEVKLYRGLKVLPNGSIDWTKANFGVSGQPATLSFFNAVTGQMPCWMVITVVAPDPVTPGVLGTLTIPDPAPGGANPGPWTALFDNMPAGHWSIAKAMIGGTSNTQSSTMAAAVFTEMARAGSAQVINGTHNDCQPPG